MGGWNATFDCLNTGAQVLLSEESALQVSRLTASTVQLSAEDASSHWRVQRPKPPPATRKHYSLKESHEINSQTQNVFRKSEGESVALFSSSPT